MAFTEQDLQNQQQEIARLASESEAYEIACGVDSYTEKENSFPVYKTLNEVKEDFISTFTNFSHVLNAEIPIVNTLLPRITDSNESQLKNKEFDISTNLSGSSIFFNDSQLANALSPIYSKFSEIFIFDNDFAT